MKTPYIHPIACLLMAFLLLQGCKEDVGMEQLGSRARLVVYCMPTASDTTYVTVTRSVPVRQYNDSAVISTVDDARVAYTVNGVARQVEPMGKGHYRVVGPQCAGDRIALSVSAEGMDEVHAEALIPEPVAVSDIHVEHKRIYDMVYESARDYEQVSATFTDDPDTRCYYAVRVRIKLYDGHAYGYDAQGYRVHSWPSYPYYIAHRDEEKGVRWDVQLTDSVYFYPRIYTQSEPVLMPSTSIDDDFGFSNDFYANFCIFDDSQINGKTHTLHLNVNMPSGLMVDRDKENVRSYQFAQACQVELYRLTPEYYHYLQSINDVQNNELARGGFSQVRPLRSNIVGGMGLLGGWNKAATRWLMQGTDYQGR